MTKTRQWKISLIILSVLLLVAMVAVCLLFVVPATAEISEVLDQTAEYEISTNMLYAVDGEVVSQWDLYNYDKIMEHWDGARNLFYSLSPSDGFTPTSYITLTVTQPGIIKFNYKGTSAGSSSSNYFHVWKNDQTEEMLVNTTSQKYSQPFTEFNSDGTLQFEIGDVLHIECRNSSNNHWIVQGLKKPASAKGIVTIQESDRALGSVSCNGQSSIDGVLTYNANFNESVTFEAKPIEGYFAYWLDEDGKVVKVSNTYETTLVSTTNFTVRFGKIGDHGEKIYWDNCTADTQYQWKIQDGKYEIANPELSTTATGTTQTSVFIDVDLQSAAILSFDYNFLRASDESHVYNNNAGSFFAAVEEWVLSRFEGLPTHWTRAFVKLDGEDAYGMQSVKYKSHTGSAENPGSDKEYSGYQQDDYVYGLGRTGAANSGDESKQTFNVYIAEPGQHTIEIRIVTAPYVTPTQFVSGEYEDERPDKTGEAFSFENVQISEKESHNFTLNFAENLGSVAVDGLGVSESSATEGSVTYSLYDDFPITLTATAKEGRDTVTSSLDGETNVNTHFINWKIDEHTSAQTTCKLEFKNGVLYFDDQQVSSADLSAIFQEDVVAPTVWSQTQNLGEAQSKKIKNNDTISLPLADAKTTSLNVIFAGYGKEGETIHLYVNDDDTRYTSLEKNGEYGVFDSIITQDMIDSFLSDTINCWVEQSLGDQYQIDVQIQIEGYVGTADCIFYISYSTDKKDAMRPDGMLPEDTFLQGNPTEFNNLFTDDSEAGAYLTSDNEIANWSPTTASFSDDDETGSMVFEGSYKNSHKEAPSSMSQDYWYYNYIGIRNYYTTKRNGSPENIVAKGVLSFDVYLEVTQGLDNGSRDAIIMICRSDKGSYSASSYAKKQHDGENVVMDWKLNPGDKYSTEQIIGLVDHKSTGVSAFTGNSGQANSFVSSLGNGWYRCYIPTVWENSYPTDASQYQDGQTYQHNAQSFVITFALRQGVKGHYAIRNVTFRNGSETTFKYSVNSNEYQSAVSANYKENPVTINSETEVEFGGSVSLTANVPEGKVFYGWEVISKGISNLVTSTAVEGQRYSLTYTVIDPVEIKAWIGDADQYEVRVNGSFYESLQSALTAVTDTGGDIVVIHDKISIEDNLTIPQGVRLIIPMNSAGEYVGSAASGKYDVQGRIAWADTQLEQKFLYFTFTISEKATLTVKGGLYLGGVVNYASQGYQGHTSGAYSQIVNKGAIVVEDGGVMDVYGRVTDNGTITVHKGGKLYEPFLILDFMGGNISLDLFMANVTPFKRYAMINIECPITINYGGKLIGHATLYALNDFTSLDQPFISDESGDGLGNETLVMLKPDSSVTITYDATKVVGGATAGNCTELIGKTTMKFTGGAAFSYMQFSALGVTVPTFGVYFAIPYNFDISLGGDEAQYQTRTDFMLMPGATVTVEEGATLTLNANTWIFDGLQQPVLASKWYPTAAELAEKGYTKSGNLIVNGTLVIDQKLEVVDKKLSESKKTAAVFLGIVQTDGTGHITIDSKAILTGKIIDGVEKDKNYFETSSTARVWDAVHERFGQLVAGKTYTATGKENFNLEMLYYATTANGAQSNSLDLTDQVLHGNWMVDHGGEHVFDWTPVDGDALGDSKYKQLTRQCTELGCNHTTHKDLFAELSDLGNATYKGSAFTQEDILAQLTTLFGIDGSAEEMFEITMPTIENANTYQITLKLVNGFWLKGEQYDATDRTWNFTVDPQNIDDAKVTVTAPQDVVFNNQTQQLEPTLQFNGGELTKDTDYSLSFAGDTTNAGTVTITIVGQNNFTGSKQVTYQITALTLSDDSLTLGGVNKSYEYNAQSQKPNPSSVLVSGIALSDYDIAYRSADDDNCVNVGTVTITVTPRETNKNFTGSATFTFEITAKNASGAQVTVNGEYDYTGYAQQPADQVEVKLDGFEMTANDYDVVFDSNIEPGEANVTVNFKGNFSGTAKGKFTISKRDVSKLTVEGIESSYEFAGHKIQPQITVKNGETRLDITTDYTVQYGDNTNVGSGTVTVTGAGKHFEGTKQFTFDITPKDASQAEVTVSGSYVYNAQQHDVKVSIQLEGYSFETSDYTIVYAEGADRTNAGAVSFSVQFNGNFTGTVADKSFTIDKANVKVTPQNAESPEGENQAQLSYTISGTMYGTDQQTLEDALSVKIENDADVSKGSAGDTFNIVVVYDNVAQLDKNYNIDVSAKGTYTITEAVFKDVKFNDSTVDYDGAAHGIEATSLPDQAKASYEYKVQGGDKLDSQPKNAGKYDVTITVTLENYKPLVLTRTLTINAKKVQVNVLDQTVTYNGKPQQAQNDAAYYAVPEGAIVNDDEVVFALSSDQITDVGSREIKLTVSGSAMGNYDISYNTAQFNVQALAIAQEGVQVTSEHVFNGKVQTPTLSVTAEGITLNAQQDYDVTYQDGRINAGDYTVTVQAKGNFSGSVTVSFNIAQAKLTNVNATGNSVYDGNDKTPVLVVGAEGGLTVDSGDYSVAYTGSRTNVGKFTIEVTATGSNYTGTVSTQFEVTPAHLDSVKNIGEYTFNRQEQKPLLEAKAGSLTLAESDYDISVQSGSLTNAGSALLKVTAKGNFEGTQTVSVTIKPATVDSVEVTGTYEYNGQQQTPQLVVKAGSLVLETTEYRLSLEGNSTNSGTVQFSVQGTGNFDGSRSGSFEIQRKKVQVTVNDGESTYGDSYQALTFSHEGLIKETDLIMSNYVSLSCSALQEECAAADTYDIVANVTQPENNYTLEVVRQGHYTVHKRDISVTVNNQSDVYGFGKDYDFDFNKWQVTEGNLLEGDVLLELVKPQFGNAGDYVIDVTSVNPNYNVTVTKGTYTISKLRVEHDNNNVIINLMVDGETVDETKLYQYAGEDFVLTGQAFVYEGDEYSPLQTSLSAETLSEVGVYDVTVTIVDDNYEGSRTFHVEVVGADGYSKNLHDVLAELERIVGDKSADTLTSSQEDFALVKQVIAEMDKLTESEKELGADELSKYLELVDTWHDAADIDDNVIETAKVLAEAPLKWLFAAAALDALLAALYVFAKGGIL